MGSLGDFIVAWTSFGQNGSIQAVIGRRYQSSGVPAGDEFQANTYTAGGQGSPSVSIGRSGEFVIAWSSYGQDGSGGGIFAQRYGLDGVPVGTELPINSYTTGHQADPVVAVDQLGGFVVAWRGNTLVDQASDVYGRHFDAGGHAETPDFLIDSYTPGYQESPAIAFGTGGTFVAAWNTESYARVGVFARLGLPVVSTHLNVDTHGAGTNLNGILEPDEAAVVEPEWQNMSASPVAQTGAASGFGGPSASRNDLRRSRRLRRLRDSRGWDTRRLLRNHPRLLPGYGVRTSTDGPLGRDLR